ncbi:toll/interleukin-1 receptor domain-containing protein [Streptomyces bobili]|uniref:toll/interleukin-1 receptor domain-containing protein n=1 Tax=Streptomyces bobili TaxID=67280 RepID=UPI0036E7CA7D
MGPDEWGLAAGIVGAVAAVVSTGFEVRGRLARRRAPALPAVDPGGSYDVFISYAEADGGPAETLASRLRAEGLRVFLGRWIGPGLVESLEKEAALHASANGLLVFSVATMNDPAIRDEYWPTRNARTPSTSYGYVPRAGAWPWNSRPASTCWG